VAAFEPVPTATGFAAIVDEDAVDPAVSRGTIVLFTREADPRIRHRTDQAFAPLLAAANGALYTARSRTLVVIDREGEIAHEHAFESGAPLHPLALRADGVLILGGTDFTAAAAEVIGWDRCDGELWRTRLEGPLGDAVISPAGELYVTAGTVLYMLDASGRVLASHDAGAFINAGPTYAGGEVVVASVAGGAKEPGTSLLIARGDRARRLEVPGPWSPARNPMVALEGAIVVRTREHLVAVELADGRERWRRWVHPNVRLELQSEARDRLLVVSGTIALVSAAGETIWEVDPPDPRQCVDGLAYDGSSLFASQCDGTFFLLGW
jgi:outer membrane protein assembly factor BamB